VAYIVVVIGAAPGNVRFEPAEGHVSTAKLRKTFEAIKGLAKTGSRGGVYCS
jgi:hypothetical protein